MQEKTKPAQRRRTRSKRWTRVPLRRKGNYWIAGKILTVSAGMGGKSKQVGTTPAETLAEELLLQLAQNGKA